jgi:subtilisin family serine protease
MKTRILQGCGRLAVLAMLVWPAAAQTQFILTAQPAAAGQIAHKYRLTLIQTLDSEEGVYLVAGPAGVSAQDLTAAVTASPGVQSFEPNSVMKESEVEPASKAAGTPAALRAALANTATVNYYGASVRGAYVNQPAASLIRLPQARQKYPTGGPVVAIIDTGVDPTHPALAGVLAGGYDFTRNQPGIPDERLDLNPSAAGVLAQSSLLATSQKTHPFVLSQSTVVILDQSTVVILDGGDRIPSDFGHGTMAAGLIHLVAPTALIMPLKAFHADGSASVSDIVRAIYYATANGAKVISMSFDSETPSPALKAAIQYASSHGVLCVAAGGNEGQQEVVYPAGFANVIGVGSTTSTDGRSLFSNYGVPSVWMAAPGEALITAYPGNNYAGVWGTSFSTALVSGTVALLSQLNPGLRYADLTDSLENCHPINSALGLGESRLDVLSSLQSLTGGL